MKQRRFYATDRLGALSDGVFAIVMTLLVLELKVPELPPGAGEQELVNDLEAMIPNFIAWLLSFVLLARFWMVHHAVVATLARCHIGTLIWNFVVLGLVSLTPFAAGLIGVYEYDAVAAAIFAAVLAATALSLGLLARHVAAETHMHRPDHVPDLGWHWRYHVRVLPLFGVASVAMTAIEARASLGVWMVEPAVAAIGYWKRRSQPDG